MIENYRLYKRNNYRIQKSIKLDDKLYARIKYIAEHEYDATLSDLINVCLEMIFLKGRIRYYKKPKNELGIYRSIMIRKDNWKRLEKANDIRGISKTRIINYAIKEFIDEYDNK